MGKKRAEKKSNAGRNVKVVLLSILILMLFAGIAVLWAYASGGKALHQSATISKPISFEKISQQQKDTYGMPATLAWQDDWLAYDGMVYEYCDEDHLNFLLLGIDCGGELSNTTDLSDWEAGQADAVFIVTIDQTKNTIAILGIPRNAMVNLNIYDENGNVSDTMYNQLCLQYGYAGGGELGLAEMKRAVSELLYGLPIHGACAVSYDAIKVITDELGGIEVTVPDDMTEFVPDFTMGSVHTLTSDNIIWYLQYRNVAEVGSPTVRLMRQKEFLKVAAAQVLARVRQNPIFVKDVYEAVAPYMNTDIALNEAVYIASNAAKCTLGEQSFYQLSGEDKTTAYTNENGEEDFFDDLYLDEEELKRILVEIFYKEVRWN